MRPWVIAPYDLNIAAFIGRWAAAPIRECTHCRTFFTRLCGLIGGPAAERMMRSAKRQTENYAKALDEWPPFLVVVDVGCAMELRSDFKRQGKAHAPLSRSSELSDQPQPGPPHGAQDRGYSVGAGRHRCRPQDRDRLVSATSSSVRFCAGWKSLSSW